MSVLTHTTHDLNPYEWSQPVGRPELAVLFSPFLLLDDLELPKGMFGPADLWAASGCLVALIDGWWRLRESGERGVLRWVWPTAGGWMGLAPGWLAGVVFAVAGTVGCMRAAV